MHYSSDKYQSIGEHKFLLPELPKNKKDILFWSKKPEDQFWDRASLLVEYRQVWYDFIPKSVKSDVYTKMFQPATLYNEDGHLISLNEEDSLYIDKIYLQERDRRVNGVWFFNEGHPTYLTGDHYFFLMYARMQRHDGEGLYADFREFQADFFYLLQHAKSSKNILGCFWSKPKKTGITNALWSGYYLNKSTLYKNRNIGYMNINLQQAVKTFNDYYMYSYNGLISPIKPEHRSLSLDKGKIVLGKSYTGSKKKPKPNGEDEDDINSSVMCVATKNKAFDVAVMSDIAFDEPTKYEESFAEIWRTNKEAVKIQSKINGKAWLFNYTEGSDTQSFRECREIFLQSKLKTISKDSKGQTNTGLICAHIPAYSAWEGAFDKHGRCNEKRAYAENNIERAKVATNKRALQSVIRQYANDEREAWGSAGAGSVFDNIRLGDLLTDVEKEQVENPENEYVTGHFEWNNVRMNLRGKRRKGEFAPVRFVPISERDLSEGKQGKVRIFKPLAAHMENLCLRSGFTKDEDNCLIAPRRFNFVFGFDPTNYAANSEVIEGSKNAGYIISMPDELQPTVNGEVQTGIVYCEYFHRAELPEESFDDFLKMIVYYSAAGVIEGNASYVATRMLEEGMGNYMFVKDENANLVLWQRWMGLSHEEDKKYQLIKMVANSSSSKDMLEMLVRLIKEYIEEPNPGEKDYGRSLKSERLLRQLMDFNPDKTREYDLVMAFGWALVAMFLYREHLLSPVNEFDSGEVISVLNALTYR